MFYIYVYFIFVFYHRNFTSRYSCLCIYSDINIIIIYVIMSGRNKCLQYNTTQNDRGTLYLLFIFKSKQKTIH